MKTFYTDPDGIDFTIHLGGTYEDVQIDEIEMKDPDGVVWYFDDNDGLLKDIITDDIIEALAYNVAYELEVEHMIDQADYLHDMMKGN